MSVKKKSSKNGFLTKSEIFYIRHRGEYEHDRIFLSFSKFDLNHSRNVKEKMNVKEEGENVF